MQYTFQEEDEDVWVADNVTISDARPPIRITMEKEGSPPSPDEIAKIDKILADTEAMIFSASELILDNYSYDHFKKLGVSEDKLVADSGEAIAAVATLSELSFYDMEEVMFAASFNVPWDPNHSFDVEFEDGEATCCAVNG